jgi:hypothetical protein
MSGSKKIFVDKSNQFKVYITYGELKIRANKAAYDFNDKIIELYDGFNGEFDQYKIAGEYFRINPVTGHYLGRKLQFGYLFATLHGEEYQFYGDYILIKNISTSPLQFPIFNLDISQLKIHPGYSLASRNTLKFFNIPFYYIPLYMEDGRRNYFEIPFPAFEVKKDIFHDTHGSIHTHYYFNPALFGDLSLRFSDQDGGGAEVQQIVRLSDHHQLQLDYVWWEKAAAQSSYSYIFHYFDNPRRPDNKLSFRQRQKQEEKIARIDPNVVLQCDYTQNEEIQRSIVDRYPDVSLTGYIYGLINDHKYTLTPTFYYGTLKEKRIFPEDQAPQDVDREYNRTKGEVNFTYFLETPRLRPFINKVLWGIDYEHSIYDPGNASRGRLSSSITARRPILKQLGFYYETILTKTLVDYGQSPFFFEEYGRLFDSAILDLYLQLPVLIAGNQFIYDLTNWQSYNEIYYVGIKAGNNYATIQYNRRFESWEFAFMRKEAAF